MKLRELLQQLVAVQRAIGASTPYITGGTPRDKFMNRLDNIADLDITTGDKTVDYLSQEFAIQLRKQYNIVRKTMDDGHSTVFVGNLKVDFSSNFVVPNIDQYLKQMGVDKITDMQREMFSRDFTCNTLLLTVDLKKLLDPTQRGFKDIREKKLRTCLAPEITLTSNRNRVVRSIYLACKLGFDIDKSIIDFVRKNPQTVKISTEKAMIEKLNQAFEKDGDKAAKLITEMGLWNLIPITDKVSPYYTKHVQGAGMSSIKTRASLFNRIVKQAKKECTDTDIEYDEGRDAYCCKNCGQKGFNGPYEPKPTVQELHSGKDYTQDDNDGPNFDYGKGLYSNMGKYKSVKDFEEHADKGPGAFFADDNADHMLPPKEHGTKIYDWKNSPYQGTPKAPKRDKSKADDENDLGTGFYENLEHYKSVRDFIERTPLGRNHGAKIKPEWERAKDVNHIDFPIDEDINHDTLIRPEEGQYHVPKLVGPSGTDDLLSEPSYTGSENIQIEFTSPQIAGEHSYLPEHDFDGRSDDALNFGRDYDDEATPVGRGYDEAFVDDLNAEMQEKEWDLDRLAEKYDANEDFDMLNPAEAEIYGLPDGVDPEAKDPDKTIQNENPYTGISDIGRQMYEDKWNI